MRSFSPLERELMTQFAKPGSDRKPFGRDDPRWDATTGLEERGLIYGEWTERDGRTIIVYSLTQIGKLIWNAIIEHNIT